MPYEVKTYLGIVKLSEDGKVVGFRKYKNARDAIKNLKEAEKEEQKESSGYALFLKKQGEIMGQLNLGKDELERIEALGREAMLEIARDKIKESAKGREREIMQGISAIGDINECINLLKERLEEVSFGESKSEVGEMLKKEIGSLEELKSGIDKKIESEISEFAPNMTHLLGASLAAMLITKAKGLEKLARMPGSRIQVMGAEKAMFRFMKTKRNPPKHGIIYTHPLVVGAQKKARGKIARALAAKIAIASKVDFFRGEFIGDKLKKAAEEKAENAK